MAFPPRRRCRSRTGRRRAGPAGGQLGELAPILPALVPGLEGLADPGENAGLMMIYHRLVGQSGHGHLLKLGCWPKYLPAPRLLTKRHSVPLHMINTHAFEVTWMTARLPSLNGLRAFRGGGPARDFHPRGDRVERHPDRDQPPDPAARAGARDKEAVRPAEPRAEPDGGGAGISPRRPRRLQRSQARHRPAAAQDGDRIPWPVSTLASLAASGCCRNYPRSRKPTPASTSTSPPRPT